MTCPSPVWCIEQRSRTSVLHPQEQSWRPKREPLTAKIGDFLDQVSERFDWVVIDSPAVSCASFEVLRDFVDGVLLVVRAMETSSKELSASLSKLKNTKVLGFVLNEAV